MTKRLYLILCLLGIGMLNISELYAQVQISDPISVTQGDDTYGKKSPKLAINSEGELMVFWMRTGNEAFFLSTLSGGTFSAPIEIPFGGLNPNLWSGSLGPNMVSQGDHVYVTFEVYGDAIYVTHSADAGQTWDAPVAAFVPPQGRRATIPTIAVDGQGQPYIAYVNTDSSESDAYYGMVRSEDFGQTFLDEVDVSANSNGAEVCECCNGHIDVAVNGDVYVAFRNNDANLRDIWLVRSTDGGSTFVSAFDVDETDWTAAVCPSNGPNFTILEDQVVTAFYSGTGASGSGVYFSSFDTNSDLVGPTVDLPLTDSNSASQNRPKIDGTDIFLGIVWQENTSNSTDIAMSISQTGVDGLTVEPFLLGSLPSSQAYPSMIYDDMRFHVVYEDSDSGTLLYQEVSYDPLSTETIEKTGFKMSPNPSSDYFDITKGSSASTELVIHDAYGKIVYAQSLLNEVTRIDVSRFSAGSYLVLVANDGALSQQKLIIVD